MNAYAAERHGEIVSTATKRSSDEGTLASAQPAAVLPHTGRGRTPMTDSLRVIGSRRYGTLSPLRYPGGKAALAGFFADIIEILGIKDARYIEPYAGGAGAGIALLREGIVQHLVVNDIDPAVHAFWKSVVGNNAEFVEMVASTPLTIDEWQRQREVYRSRDERDALRLSLIHI